MIAIVAIAIGFTACSDDDGDNIDKKQLYGEWVCVHSQGKSVFDGEVEEEWDTSTPPKNNIENDYNQVNSTFTFHSDGTCEFYLYLSSHPWGYDWKLSGNTLTLYDEEEDVDEKYTISKLDDNVLILEYKYNDDGWVTSGKDTYNRVE